MTNTLASMIQREQDTDPEKRNALASDINWVTPNVGQVVPKWVSASDAPWIERAYRDAKDIGDVVARGALDLPNKLMMAVTDREAPAWALRNLTPAGQMVQGANQFAAGLRGTEVAENIWDQPEPLVDAPWLQRVGNMATGISNMALAYAPMEKAVGGAVGSIGARVADKWPMQKGVYVGPKSKAWTARPQIGTEGETVPEGAFSSLYDRKPRVEIDDSGANVIPRDSITSWGTREDMVQGNSTTGKVNLVYDHPELFNAYPEEIDSIGVGLIPRNQGGAYIPEENFIRVGYDPKTGNVNKNILTHELQHAIQEREGFARGGSPDSITPDIAQARLKLKELEANQTQLNNKLYDEARLYVSRSNTDPEFKSYVDGARDVWFSKLGQRSESNPFGVDDIDAVKFQLMTEDPIYNRNAQEMNRIRNLASYDPQQAYSRLAGEIEARDAAARANMTMAERRATPPYSSENIPVNEAIVRFDRKEPSMSVPVNLKSEPKWSLLGSEDRKKYYDPDKIKSSGPYRMWDHDAGEFHTFANKAEEDAFREEYPFRNITEHPADDERTWYRFGLPPETNRSYNFTEQKAEPGVSVYATKIGSNPFFSDRPLYSGKGVQIGWGSDGEPVVIPTSKWKKVPIRGKRPQEMSDAPWLAKESQGGFSAAQSENISDTSGDIAGSGGTTERRLPAPFQTGFIENQGQFKQVMAELKKQEQQHKTIKDSWFSVNDPNTWNVAIVNEANQTVPYQFHILGDHEKIRKMADPHGGIKGWKVPEGLGQYSKSERSQWNTKYQKPASQLNMDLIDDSVKYEPSENIPVNEAIVRFNRNGPQAMVRPGEGGQVEGYVEGPERDANFKKWFGDSKVVDEQGEPLVVYHSTLNNFDKFKKTRGSHFGYHFGTQDAAADRASSVLDSLKKKKTVDNLQDVKESISKQFNELSKQREAIFDKARSRSQQDNTRQENFIKALDSGDEIKIKEAIDNLVNYTDEENNALSELQKELNKLSDASINLLTTTEGSKVLPVYINPKKLLRTKDAGHWGSPKNVAEATGFDGKTLNEIMDNIKSAGYDGIVYKNLVEDSILGNDSYIVFDPNQIKSKFNRGTFDPKDPRILYGAGAGLAAYSTTQDNKDVSDAPWISSK